MLSSMDGRPPAFYLHALAVALLPAQFTDEKVIESAKNKKYEHQQGVHPGFRLQGFVNIHSDVPSKRQ